MSFVSLTLHPSQEVLERWREKYWDSIDPSFMSKESTHECDGESVVHKHIPTFRSEG